MFAILALVTFLVGLFGGHIAGINLLYLGLAFIAAHLIFPWPTIPIRKA